MRLVNVNWDRGMEPRRPGIIVCHLQGWSCFEAVAKINCLPQGAELRILRFTFDEVNESNIFKSVCCSK